MKHSTMTNLVLVGLRYKKNSYKNRGAISKQVGDVAGNI